MMAASPVLSEVFSLIALLIISLIVLLILRYYLPLRTTPAYLLVPIFFALWLPAGIILLVPIDLASNASTDDDNMKGIWLYDRVLLVSWRITYWLTFALTWFILPILAEYSDAGYREPTDRIMYALRENAKYHAVVFGCGAAALVYVFIYSGVSLLSLKSMIVALAYCWALVLAIYLMGHGLVSIPRSFFRTASISGRLRRLQAHAPKLYEKMEDSLAALEELEMQVAELGRRKTGSARDYQDWIEELLDMCSLPDARPRPNAPAPSSASRVLPTVITDKYLADLTRQLIRARHARSCYVDEWNRLLAEASSTQAILDSAASKKLELGAASAESSILERLTILTPYTRYLLHYHAMPYLRMLLGAGLALASISILWSELVRIPFPAGSVIRITVIHHWDGENGQVNVFGQIIAAFWLCYMCAAALASVAEVKVWRGRALVKRNTAHESAFWYASLVARLTVPLSYNFLTFFGRQVYEKTTFYEFLGQLIDLTPLGQWFDYLFPMCVLIPVFATLFGLYGRAKRIMGIGMDIVQDDENEPAYGTGSWREGRDMIERELNGTSTSRRWDDLTSGARARPILSVPDANRGSGGGVRTPFSTSPSYRDNAGSSSTAAAGQSSRTRAEAVPEDDGFFANLGHRFKNTLDTMDTPKWFQDIGDGLKRPRWMGGGDSDASGSGSGGGAQRPANTRADSGVRRWFGGENGRIRL